MTALSAQMAAYDGMRDLLETDHFGKWVVFHGGELVGIYDNDAAAVTDAGHRFGYGPYLIREVGAGPYRLPPVVEFGLF